MDEKLNINVDETENKAQENINPEIDEPTNQDNEGVECNASYTSLPQFRCKGWVSSWLIE